MNTMPANVTLFRSPLSWVLIAGLVGGLAEVAWVSLYAALTPLDGATVGREITETVFGDAAGGAYAPFFGFGIHMVLSIALAAAFTVALWRWAAHAGKAGILGASIGTLAAIWAMNFFVVLPATNPAFVGLMPLSVTFTSKMLFGAAMGLALCRVPRRSPA